MSERPRHYAKPLLQRCELCGDPFSASKASVRYCSPEHKRSADRARMRRLADPHPPAPQAA